MHISDHLYNKYTVYGLLPLLTYYSQHPCNQICKHQKPKGFSSRKVLLFMYVLIIHFHKCFLPILHFLPKIHFHKATEQWKNSSSAVVHIFSIYDTVSLSTKHCIMPFLTEIYDKWSSNVNSLCDYFSYYSLRTVEECHIQWYCAKPQMWYTTFFYTSWKLFIKVPLPKQFLLLEEWKNLPIPQS